MTGTAQNPAAVARPFTMLGSNGVVCEGDVCVVPEAEAD